MSNGRDLVRPCEAWRLFVFAALGNDIGEQHAGFDKIISTRRLPSAPVTNERTSHPSAIMMGKPWGVEPLRSTPKMKSASYVDNAEEMGGGGLTVVIDAK